MLGESQAGTLPTGEKEDGRGEPTLPGTQPSIETTGDVLHV